MNSAIFRTAPTSSVSSVVNTYEFFKRQIGIFGPYSKYLPCILTKPQIFDGQKFNMEGFGFVDQVRYNDVLALGDLAVNGLIALGYKLYVIKFGNVVAKDPSFEEMLKEYGRAVMRRLTVMYLKKTKHDLKLDFKAHDWMLVTEPDVQLLLSLAKLFTGLKFELEKYNSVFEVMFELVKEHVTALHLPTLHALLADQQKGPQLMYYYDQKMLSKAKYRFLTSLTGSSFIRVPLDIGILLPVRASSNAVAPASMASQDFWALAPGAVRPVASTPPTDFSLAATSWAPLSITSESVVSTSTSTSTSTSNAAVVEVSSSSTVSLADSATSYKERTTQADKELEQNTAETAVQAAIVKARQMELEAVMKKLEDAKCKLAIAKALRELAMTEQEETAVKRGD